MEIVTDLSKFQAKKPVVVALGNFDGVHKGHQSLIKQTIEEAGTEGSSAVMVFDPHPRKVLGLDNPKLLTTVEGKADILNAMGLDYLILIPFTREIASWTPEHFADEIIVKQLQASSVYVGYNYHFGNRAAGTAELLQSLGKAKGFKVQVVDPVLVDDQIVSSTLIRRCLDEGDIESVRNLTGRWPILRGTVKRGEQRGLGFPTANLELDPELAQPALGVYAARAKVGDELYDAVVNIGQKPTFHEEHPVLAEAHLLGFSRELYDEDIAVMLHRRLREERKFPDSGSLIAQINHDVEETKRVLEVMKTEGIIPK